MLLEFNFVDFAFVTFLQCTAKMFVWYLISQKQFIELHTRNLQNKSPTKFKAFTVCITLVSHCYDTVGIRKKKVS